MPAIAPTPPPSDAPPPTIELGQTKDQVTTALGQPVKIVKLGAKEIFYYKDLKVTFTAGKISNVE
jgi:outer membrane protein assembly factor BamE (lipoprotein component of BamABCDE complex)